MKILGTLIVSLATICMGCSSDSSSITPPNMSDLASSVLPHVVSTSTTTSVVLGKAFAAGFTADQEMALQGTEGFSIYRTFADPALDPSYPNDSWGVDNLRNNLDIARALSDLMAQSKSTATTVETKVHGTDFSMTAPANQTITSTVTSPYSFSNIPAGIAYDTGLPAAGLETPPISIYSVWQAADTFSMISTQYMSDKNEHTVFEGQYTSATGALRLNRASRVQTDGGYFITRLEVEGNTTTSEFTLRMSNRSTQVGGSHMSIAGKGFGSGDGKFFALKVAVCNNSADCLASATTAWYCISAAALASDYIAFINDGTTYVDQAGKITRASSHASFTGDCATYATALDAASLALFTDADMPDTDSPYASTFGM